MKIQNIIDHIKPSQKELVNHKIYSKISSLDDLKIFMENHIYAVWDFMSLLKALQVNLTCVRNPWTPSENAQAARFINEIVLEEETDEIKGGKVISHFELYIEAMKQIGADTSKIDTFICDIKNSEDYRSFINDYDVADDMFIEIVKGLNKENSNVASHFVYYLERHIELDGDDHGPIALKMIENLCGNDEKKWEEVKEISKRSIDMRIKLWSHISSKIEHEYTTN
jgi:hypothetical protein